MDRTQTMMLSGSEPSVSLDPVSPLGNPGLASVELTLAEMPQGSWFLRALTDTPAVLEAQTTELDPETLHVKASFGNFNSFPVAITGYVVEQE